jgi:two-component system, LytTR family, sensor kinase
MDSDRLRPRSHWLWIASIWFGIALFDATQTVFVMRSEGMHHAWGRLFVTLFLSWIPWALATPVVLALANRYPPGRWQQLSTWMIHAATFAAVGLVQAAWRAVLDVWLDPWAYPGGPGSFGKNFSNVLYNSLLAYLVLYITVLVVGAMLASRERLTLQQSEAARLAEQLSKAQLSALRQQIEPHFLFNTLNAIAGLVREHRNEAAVSMIVQLSDLFRRLLENSNQQEVPLGQEVDFLQRYLDIQKARFADRLQLSFDVPLELMSAPIPSLILQPVVENAVKHGIAKRAQGGIIRISASRLNGMLTLRIFNDGPRLPDDFERTPPGIGISNVRTRLERLYGDRFDLCLCNQEPDGVEVLVSVPFREA